MNKQTEKAICSIGRSIANINKQIDAIRKEYPEAIMYVEDGVNYNIMKGLSHEVGGEERPLHENVIGGFVVKYSECGAW